MSTCSSSESDNGRCQLGDFFDVNFFMCSRKFVLITSDGSLCVLDPGVE